jgi:ribosomal protein S27AE
MRRLSWTNEQLITAVRESSSIRQVITKLNLIPAGGNYVAIQRAINRLHLDTTHFLGMGWRKGAEEPVTKARPISTFLKEDSGVQSHKLKNKLFTLGIKKPKCEECGWAVISADGRLPLELDHINGVKTDNRVENLRVLCPNCHSLKPTHRGKNKKPRW